MSSVKTAFITGASSGIGRATVDLMLKRGWRVAATSRTPSELSEYEQRGDFRCLPVDLSDPRSIEEGIASAVRDLGSLDVVVNNAGYGVFGPVESVSDAELRRQLDINVIAPIAVVRSVLPHMRAQGGGVIVNVSSIGGRTAAPFASLYHASKFAIEGFSESVRYELLEHNIRVKLVEPAHFRTGFIERSLVRLAHPAYDRRFANYMKWVMREDASAPSPEPVAEAILRAASDGSHRLRYPVKGGFMVALSSLLPGAMWRGLMAEGMTRLPRGEQPPGGG